MRQFLRISSFLSSLALLFISCSPVSGFKKLGKTVVTEAQVSPIIDPKNSLLYKAKIDIYRRHFSGLIVLKQTTDSTAYVTFITEIGMKMFDYEIKRGNYNLLYAFEPLKNPRLLKPLEADLKLMLLKDLFGREAAAFEKKNRQAYLIKGDRRYYYRTLSREMEKITVKGNLFTKQTVNYLYINGKLEQLYLRHKGPLPLRMKFERIDQK